MCTVVLRPSSAAAQSQDPPVTIRDLKRLSIEQLTDVEVTSVSKAVERLIGAAAAVTVVTSEDIRRSGATTVPDALRLVPGVHVARQTSNTWAVSSRGFSSINSEKLLVLSDTRSVYTPLYSGVFWDVQDYLLQDVERIEVIRGPGATLWGSNAVNGVINITTKNAKDTQGLYAETTVGSRERTNAAARYGGRIGDRGYYRVFGTFADRDASFIPAGPTSDDWRLGHVGTRADWDTIGGATFTLQGDAYGGTIDRLSPSASVTGRPGPTGKLQVDVGGGNVLGRLERRKPDGSGVALRVYYDRTHRNDPSFVDDLHTVDAEFQHRFTLAPRHDVTWAVNDRLMMNRNVSKGLFRLDPSFSRDNLLGGFVQDQWTIRNPLRLTLGTKLEHNDFSGVEVQPSTRIAWDITPPQTLWASVSRAVRVPTRLERDTAIDATDPARNPVVRLVGNDQVDSEALLAYELGYRWQVTRPLFIDVAAFHNRYDGLMSLELETPFVDTGAGRTVIPLRNRNLTDGHTRGAEILGTISPREDWRVTGSYAYLDMSLHPHGQDRNRGRFLDGATPRHQIGVRSLLDLRAGLQVDASLRSLSAVRRLPGIVAGTGFDGYAELDLRFAWRGWQQAEISVVGQNLLHGHHVEFGPPAQRGEVERGVYTKIAWGF